MYTQELLKNISNQEIKDYIIELDKKYNFDETFAKAASSGGKYHPAICNQEGGLFHHTNIMIKIAHRLFDLYQPLKPLTKLDKDMLTAGVILHDAWKYYDLNRNKCSHTTKEHGLVGYQLIIENCPDNHPCHEAIFRIATIVRFHMSNWCYPKEEIEIAHETKDILAHICMQADMIASSREIMHYCKEKL